MPFDVGITAIWPVSDFALQAIGLHTMLLQAIPAEWGTHIFIFRLKKWRVASYQSDQGATALDTVLLLPMDGFCLLIFNWFTTARAKPPWIF